MKKAKHGPNNWDNYLSVHDKVLSQYRQYFVNQNIEYKPERITETYGYSYHAWLTKTNENLVRYCSPHETHNKFHHKHIYKNGEELKIEKVGDDDWPHVNEFLDEVLGGY